MALTPQQIADYKVLVAAIWGDSVANNLYEYNEDVEGVLNTAVKALADCNTNISILFASLFGSVGTLTMYTVPWLRSFVLDLAKEIIANRAKLGWSACINSVAAAYRSPLEMAAQGI